MPVAFPKICLTESLEWLDELLSVWPEKKAALVTTELAALDFGRLRWGRFVKRSICLLVAVTSFLPSLDLSAQEHSPEQTARYHLIQLVDPGTFLEKVNDAAAAGYRLIAITAAPSSMVAVMERIEQASMRYNYLSIPVHGAKSKFETAGKAKTRIAEELNEAGAKGYRVRFTLPNLAVMESGKDALQNYEYVLSSPGGFGYFKKDEISGFLAAGYHWAASITTFLVFERAMQADSSQDGTKARPPVTSGRRFTFPENNFVRSELPEKQLHKLAAEGARVIDFFGSPAQMMLAMEEATPAPILYQYIVLKPRNQASPLALRAKMSKVEAADLTRVGQQGFRFLRLSAPVPPFVMEKAPSSRIQYEYQFLTAATLPDLAEQLNGPGQNGFNVAKIVSTDEGFLVVLEKSSVE